MKQKETPKHYTTLGRTSSMTWFHLNEALKILDEMKQKENELFSDKKFCYDKILHYLCTMENKELTFGQQAVGLNFNHAEGVINERVHRAKQLSADLIDLIEEHQNYTHSNTISSLNNVFRTAAFNAIIAAQMACVKFITWTNK